MDAIKIPNRRAGASPDLGRALRNLKWGWVAALVLALTDAPGKRRGHSPHPAAVAPVSAGCGTRE